MAALPDLPPFTDHHSWLARRHNIREMVAKEDPEKFVSWPTIQGTMFVADGHVVKAELAALKASDDWDRWRIAILDTAECGAPRSKLIDTLTTGNMIHQTYHLMRFEEAVGQRVEDMYSIYEYGGGYGSMARVAHNLGFRGKYGIYDLPEFSLLQEFYLSRCDVPAICVSGSPTRLAGIEVDLLIALWSISEVPYRDRMEFYDQIRYKYHLLSFSDAWDGWDNLDWFRGMAKYYKSRMIWKELKIPHLNGHHYLISEPRTVRQEI
jgi:hypothetical protein